MRSGVIYRIKCLVNGKVYVGSSRNKDKRRTMHFSDLRKGGHGNEYLQAAYNKHGKDNFVFEILEECNEDKLLVREQYWMTELKSCEGKHGYNLAISAKSRPDTALLWSDPEFRKTQPVKISATMKRLSETDKAKERLTKISNGYWGAEESRKKVSSRMLNAWASLPEDEKKRRQQGLCVREIVNYITLNGITKPLIEWSELSGLPRGLLRERLKKGITGNAMFAPARVRKPKPEFVVEWLK